MAKEIWQGRPCRLPRAGPTMNRLVSSQVAIGAAPCGVRATRSREILPISLSPMRRIALRPEHTVLVIGRVGMRRSVIGLRESSSPQAMGAVCAAGLHGLTTLAGLLDLFFSEYVGCSFFLEVLVVRGDVASH
jgi:hypothetical protein